MLNHRKWLNPSVAEQDAQRIHEGRQISPGGCQLTPAGGQFGQVITTIQLPTQLPMFLRVFVEFTSTGSRQLTESLWIVLP